MALDLKLTDDLIREGYLRETISKIQTMRRDLDFEVTDRISIYFAAGDTLTNLLNGSKDVLKKEVLAKEILPLDEAHEGEAKVWSINALEIKLYLEPHKAED